MVFLVPRGREFAVGQGSKDWFACYGGVVNGVRACATALRVRILFSFDLLSNAFFCQAVYVPLWRACVRAGGGGGQRGCRRKDGGTHIRGKTKRRCIVFSPQ